MKRRRVIRKSRKYRLLVVVLLIVMGFMFPVHVSASECMNDNMRIEILNMVMRNKYIKEEAIVTNTMTETIFFRDETISNNLEGKTARYKQYVNDVQPISNQVCTETKITAKHQGNGSGVIHIGTTTLDHTVINPLICLIVLCGYTIIMFEKNRSEGYLC